MTMEANTQTMAVFAGGLVVLAIVSVIGIVVLDQFKTSILMGVNGSTQPNTTIDLFITGLAVFGTFATVIALVLVAKVILSLVKGGFN